MKKRSLFAHILFLVSILSLPKDSFSQGADIGTSAPDASATLDITAARKTAQEQNSSHFDIEKRIDGIHRTVMGNLPAVGNNSNSVSSYSFTENNPVQNGYYRISEYDLDGRVQYTGVLRSSCNTTNKFSLWPNPVRDRIFINIVTDIESQVIINVFDSKGSLVKMQRAAVLHGSNQLSVDMKPLANGVYQLSAVWNNGQMKRTVQILKQ